MAAYRMDGGRLFYVEHECQSARGPGPNPRHMLNNKVHHAKYVVRMYYIGELSTSRANVNSFAYMTENVMGEGGTNAYVNCPLCGSEGRIATDANNLIELKESLGRTEMTESPFR